MRISFASIALLLGILILVALVGPLFDLSVADIRKVRIQASLSSKTNQSRYSTSVSALGNVTIVNKTFQIRTTYRFVPFNSSIAHSRRGSHDGYVCNGTAFHGTSILQRLPLSDRDASYLTSFSTEISTNAKLLIQGDSVAMQLYDIFRATGTGEVVFQSFLSFDSLERITLAISSQHGGGIIAGWRITDFLLREKEGYPLPSVPHLNVGRQGGWTREQASLLKNVSLLMGRHTTLESYDTLLFRVPSNWQPLTSITNERLVKSLELAHELVGVTTVILMTPSFTNKHADQEERELFVNKTSLIRRFAKTYVPGAIPGIQRVVVLDMARLIDELMWYNMKRLEINTTSSFRERCTNFYVYWPYQPGLRCGKLSPTRSACLCVLNSFTYDGVHFCPEEFAGRLKAATACLLKCLYEEPSSSSCRHCNDRFMSLTHINTSVTT